MIRLSFEDVRGMLPAPPSLSYRTSGRVLGLAFAPLMAEA